MTEIPEEFKPFLSTIFDRKPQTASALDVRGLTSYADLVVIIGAGSQRQVTSLAEHVITTLKKMEIQALGTEGVKKGEWALLDYGAIIIHVFESRAREFYDLEGLWSDAPAFDLSEFGYDPQNVENFFDD